MKVNQKNKTRIGISLLCAIILLTGCHITPNKKQDGEKKKYPKLVVVYSGVAGEVTAEGSGVVAAVGKG